ncbi:MAG: DUF2066 domain-containing protein [Emcibacter sp.]|nr:DUF2066 domain-containing protein [Emcibacter sp.]
MSFGTAFPWADDRTDDISGTQILIPKIYTIYNISMDETAATSRRASLAALRKAERIALDKLFRKIIREEDQARLPELSPGQITEIVSGIEIANEKSSHVRYMADFTVHFSRAKIYNFLSVLQIPFAETLSNGVSILTLLEKDGATILWEKNNDWRKAWEAYDTVNNLVPVRIIAPSLAHRMAITAWQAKNGDISLLQKFAEQKNIRHLYVMNARVIYDFSHNKNMIELVIIGNDGNKTVHKNIVVEGATVTETGRDELSELYNEAIKKATYWLDNRWKEKVMIHFDSSSHLTVDIHFNQSEDWFEIKKRLENISLIRNMVIKRMTTHKAMVEMEHSGDVEQITLALDQKDLELVRDEPALTDPADNMKIQNRDPSVRHSWILTLKK